MKGKLLGVLLVVAVGLMIGLIVSKSLPANKDSEKTSVTNQNGVPINNGQISDLNIHAEMTVQRPVIKSIGAKADLKNDFAKIEKSIIQIKYKNNTGTDLTNLKMQFNINGPKSGLHETEKTRINTQLSAAAKRYIFDVPDAKAGATGTAVILFYAFDPGTTKITAELKTTEGKLIKSNSITITSN